MKKTTKKLLALAISASMVLTPVVALAADGDNTPAYGVAGIEQILDNDAKVAYDNAAGAQKAASDAASENEAAKTQMGIAETAQAIADKVKADIEKVDESAAKALNNSEAVDNALKTETGAAATATKAEGAVNDAQTAAANAKTVAESAATAVEGYEEAAANAKTEAENQKAIATSNEATAAEKKAAADAAQVAANKAKAEAEKAEAKVREAETAYNAADQKIKDAENAIGDAKTGLAKMESDLAAAREAYEAAVGVSQSAAEAADDAQEAADLASAAATNAENASKAAADKLAELTTGKTYVELTNAVKNAEENQKAVDKAKDAEIAAANDKISANNKTINSKSEENTSIKNSAEYTSAVSTINLGNTRKTGDGFLGTPIDHYREVASKSVGQFQGLYKLTENDITYAKEYVAKYEAAVEKKAELDGEISDNNSAISAAQADNATQDGIISAANTAKKEAADATEAAKADKAKVDNNVFTAPEHSDVLSLELTNDAYNKLVADMQKSEGEYKEAAEDTMDYVNAKWYQQITKGYIVSKYSDFWNTIAAGLTITDGEKILAAVVDGKLYIAVVDSAEEAAYEASFNAIQAQAAADKAAKAAEAATEAAKAEKAALDRYNEAVKAVEDAKAKVNDLSVKQAKADLELAKVELNAAKEDAAAAKKDAEDAQKAADAAKDAVPSDDNPGQGGTEGGQQPSVDPADPEGGGDVIDEDLPVIDDMFGGTGIKTEHDPKPEPPATDDTPATNGGGTTVNTNTGDMFFTLGGTAPVVTADEKEAKVEEQPAGEVMIEDEDTPLANIDLGEEESNGFPWWIIAVAVVVLGGIFFIAGKRRREEEN